MSAYAAAVGLPAYVFMPNDVPPLFQVECRELGAQVNAGRRADQRLRRQGA